MAKTKLVKGFLIKIKESEMARILGYGVNKFPPRVRTILREAMEASSDLISPSCIYRLMNGDELSLSDYLKGTGKAVLCLVTIGPKLENQVNKIKEQGDLTRAIILDAYGSAAAEACADAAEDIIRADCQSLGAHCSARFSPGYGGWKVSEQRWILKAVEADKLNVRISEGCMMIPRKSITFAVKVSDSPLDNKRIKPCDTCGMINCTFKHPSKGEH